MTWNAVWNYLGLAQIKDVGPIKSLKFKMGVCIDTILMWVKFGNDLMSSWDFSFIGGVHLNIILYIYLLQMVIKGTLTKVVISYDVL